jgi:putative hydrolase of the HAD superfamily
VAVRIWSKKHPARLKNAKAIFFDVGGTLVYGSVGHIDRLYDALGHLGYIGTREDVVRANDRARRAVARHRRRRAAGLDPTDASRMWLDHLADELGLGVGGAVLERELAYAVARTQTDSEPELDPEALPLLERLQQRDFRLGVISNWSADLPDYLEELGLAHCFEVVIASEAVGAQKPHREIFLRALAATKCPPRRAVHVGDDYWADVVGARSIGIHPVLIDRHRETADPDCTTITRLRDLEPLL